MYLRRGKIGLRLSFSLFRIDQLRCGVRSRVTTSSTTNFERSPNLPSATTSDLSGEPACAHHNENAPSPPLLSVWAFVTYMQSMLEIINLTQSVTCQEDSESALACLAEWKVLEGMSVSQDITSTSKSDWY